jgi:hypothetical protein
MQAEGFDILEGHRFMNLTTFYEDGRARTTPVWFAREGDTLYVTTGADSWKVRRLRKTSRCTVQPCDSRGNPLDGGPIAEAVGAIHEEGTPTAQKADKLLNKKYGLLKHLFTLMGRLRGNERAFLSIEPAATPRQ